jgi:3-keto-disaccharide hydrolase
MTSLFKRVSAASGAIIIGSAGFLLTTTLTVSAQAPGAWKPLFNGKDFTGWTVIGGGRGRATGPGAQAPATPPAAPSTNPEERGWKIDNGVITSGPPPEGQRSGSLATVDKFKDVELEFDFLLAEAGAKCTPKLGEKQANLSEDKTCTFNSGVTLRTAYQLNLGRREAGEYIGIVVHRTVPEAIRGNVDWLSSGDCGSKHGYLEDCDKFPMLRKKGDWNHVRIAFKGTHLQAWLNGKQIADVTDDPTDPAEASWKEAAPITFQWPPAGESGGFAGSVKYKNIRVREL